MKVKIKHYEAVAKRRAKGQGMRHGLYADPNRAKVLSMLENCVAKIAKNTDTMDGLIQIMQRLSDERSTGDLRYIRANPFSNYFVVAFLNHLEGLAEKVEGADDMFEGHLLAMTKELGFSKKSAENIMRAWSRYVPTLRKL